MIIALTRRADASDLDVLAVLWEVREAADRATAESIAGLRARGVPWSALADGTGLTRQGLCQWYLRRAGDAQRLDLLTEGPRSPGGMP
jgi:hypothetical protein